MNVAQLTRRIVVAGFTLLVALLLASCQAPMDQKQGGLGEFCNGDDTTCRQGLACIKGVCQSLNNSVEVCETVCSKFSECEFGRGNCERNCRTTVQKWGKEKTASYASCYEDSSCLEIETWIEQDPENRNPPSYCYGKLKLSEERLAVCKDIRSTAEYCLGNASGGDYSDQYGALMSGCKRQGRTFAERYWKETLACKEHGDADPVRCGDMFACVNDQYSIKDKNAFPTQDPNPDDNSNDEDDDPDDGPMQDVGTSAPDAVSNL